MLKYPDQAEELIALLKADQEEYKAHARRYYWGKSSSDESAKAKVTLDRNFKGRAERMLEILDEIGEPSLANIGSNAAQAVSVLALHAASHDLSILKRVLDDFNQLYKRDKADTFYQAIPSMADCWLLLQRKPERFATQWAFDKNKEPYLPPVEDFDPKDAASVERLNQRRAEYGVEPFRWPKSSAIPEDEQPWLQRPLSELVMRELTDEEYDELKK